MGALTEEQARSYNDISDLAKLGLPETFKDIIMIKRGLLLVVYGIVQLF